MATNSYTIGQQVRLSVVITNITGTKVDPTTGPVLTVKDPAGALTTRTYPTDATLIRDGVGEFHYDHLPASAGPHHVRWSGAGTNAGAAEAEIFIERSEVI